MEQDADGACNSAVGPMTGRVLFSAFIIILLL